MSDPTEHGALPTDKDAIHVPYEWTYANAAARAGASGFISSDVGKLAKQLDNNTFWQLTATTPTWALAGGNLGTAALATLGVAALNALQLTASAKVPSTVLDFTSDTTGVETGKPADAKGVADLIAALAPDSGGVGATIVATRSMTAASGSVNYNTSESTKTPKAAFIFHYYDGNNWGFAYADGTNAVSFGKITGVETFMWDSYVLSPQQYTGDIQRVAASGVSFSAGKVTLSWVKVGSPAGTLYLKIVPLY